MTIRGALIADIDSGEGDIKLPKGFDDLGALMKADLLMDWSGQLAHLYSKALEDLNDALQPDHIDQL